MKLGLLGGASSWNLTTYSDVQEWEISPGVVDNPARAKVSSLQIGVQGEESVESGRHRSRTLPPPL